MKYNYKKLIFIIMILVIIVMVLPACSKMSLSKSVEGQSFDASTKDTELIFEFNKDGTVEISAAKEKKVTGAYYQDEESIKIEVYGYIYNCTYDGKTFEVIDEGFIEKGQEKDIKTEETLKFIYDNIEREYVLYLPDDYQNASLVFVLHGFGGDISVEDSYMRFSEYGNNNNYIVCYPQGLSGSEKDGAYWNANWGLKDDADDIGFLSSLAEYLFDEYNIDEESVYVCGYSNGGFMSYTLAIYASDVFKKVAVVSGLMSESDWYSKDDASPIPILHIHGMQDDVIKIENSQHYSMSVAEIVGFWSKINNCNQVSEKKLGENTTIYKHTGGDADVWYYKVDNWGHEIPDKRSTDFDVAELIYEFFDN